VVAKMGLKAALHTTAAVPEWWGHLPRLLELAAVATTLVLARYLWLLRTESRGDSAPLSVWVGWGLVLAAAPALILLPEYWGLTARSSVTAEDWVRLGWPVLAGTLLALLGIRWLRPWPIPPGDLLTLITPRPDTVSRIRVPATKAARWVLRLLDPARLVAIRAPSRFLRPDRLWQREVALVFAAVLVVLLAAGLS
jgi:hydrogenase-4 component B